MGARGEQGMSIDTQLSVVPNSLTTGLLRESPIEKPSGQDPRPVEYVDIPQTDPADDAAVSVSFVQTTLIQTAIEVIGGNIAESGAEEAGETPEPSPANSHGEKIAERILHKIGKRIDHVLKKLAKIESRSNSNVKAIEKRIDQVVREFDKILPKALRGKLAQLQSIGVDHEDGDRLLGDIGDRLLPGVGLLTSSIDSAEVATAASIERERSFSLEVRTQEGDTVTIQIESRNSESTELSASRNEDGVSFRAASESFSSQSLSFTVEGNLNEDEQSAIAGLIRNAEQLSNQFYAGDFEAAFEAAQNLQYDSGEISGFELDLQQRVQATVAASYTEIAQLDEHAEESQPVQSSLAGSIDDLSNRFELDSLFDDAAGLVRQLLDGVLLIHPAAAEDDA